VAVDAGYAFENGAAGRIRPTLAGEDHLLDSRWPGSLLQVNPPVPLADWPTESTVTPPLRSTDTKVEQCLHFVGSVLEHDLSESNAGFWSDVALVGEAVQESVRLEGCP
jgi:hypothetical protein